MGISQLNSYLKSHCAEHIHSSSLSVLRKKKIVIDIQMYLYSFMCMNNTSFTQNMYLLCSLLVQYEVIPLFVFDCRKIKDVEPNLNINLDKCPKQKERKEERYEAIDKLVKLINNPDDFYLTENNWKIIKRQIVSINNAQIEKIKTIIKLFGFTYIDAEDEADEVCAHATISNNTYGCLSNDTDMFAYGCLHIFRDLNIFDQTISVVDVSAILTKLNITREELREICVLSKNDYNCEQKNILTMPQIMEQFQQYKQEESERKNQGTLFYKWFIQRNDNYKNYEELFKKIYNIFDVYAKPNKMSKIHFHNSEINRNLLKKTINSVEGFCI